MRRMGREGEREEGIRREEGMERKGCFHSHGISLVQVSPLHLEGLSRIRIRVGSSEESTSPLQATQLEERRGPQPAIPHSFFSTVPVSTDSNGWSRSRLIIPVELHGRKHQDWEGRASSKKASFRHVHPNVHCSTVYNSQDMEATQMPISRRMDKEAVVHIHHGILLSH